MKKIAALFVRPDSIYKAMPHVDAFDMDRNALSFDDSCPVVAHPPCRAWGRLKHFARPRDGEKELAIWSVERVRKNGGVLEHPSGSSLWREAGLPAPGARDAFGGFTIKILQWWFGHRADKPTLLYVCGCEPSEIPPIPFREGPATHVITTSKGGVRRPHVTMAEREHTPPMLAEWLVGLAGLCQKKSTNENVSVA